MFNVCSRRIGCKQRMVVNKKQTNNKFYSILTLKRSFAASIKWFAFRYLNIVKGFTITWIFVTIIERFLAR